MLAGVLDRLEGIDLAGEVVCIAVAAIRVQDEAVGDEQVLVVLPLLDEAQLRPRFAAAMPPEIEAMTQAQPRHIIRRDDDAVRLDRTIDLREIAARDRPDGGVPGRLTVTQALRPVAPLCQQ